MPKVKLSDGNEYEFAALPATMLVAEWMSVLESPTSTSSQRMRALALASRRSLTMAYPDEDTDAIMDLIDLNDEEAVTRVSGAMFFGRVDADGAVVAAKDSSVLEGVGENAVGDSGGN